jgi:hypothetical protein
MDLPQLSAREAGPFDLGTLSSKRLGTELSARLLYTSEVSAENLSLRLGLVWQPNFSMRSPIFQEKMN